MYLKQSLGDEVDGSVVAREVRAQGEFDEAILYSCLLMEQHYCPDLELGG